MISKIKSRTRCLATILKMSLKKDNTPELMFKKDVMKLKATCEEFRQRL